MRNILCGACAAPHLPVGTRKVYERSINGPAEFQRLILGKAKPPTQENRYIAIDGVKELLPLAGWNCDTCNTEIKPGDLCAAWSVWTEEMQPIRDWEDEYLTRN